MTASSPYIFVSGDALASISHATVLSSAEASLSAGVFGDPTQQTYTRRSLNTGKNYNHIVLFRSIPIYRCENDICSSRGSLITPALNEHAFYASLVPLRDNRSASILRGEYIPFSHRHLTN